MLGDAYSVELTRSAEKDLKDLRPWVDRVVGELLKLEQDPTRGHTLSGSMKGARSLEFSLTGGAYRAAYVILAEKRVCLVFMVGPHEGFYQQAERRLKALRKFG